jgi:protein SCO1/2
MTGDHGDSDDSRRVRTRRRTLLAAAGATALTLETAGCLDAVRDDSSGATDDVVLDAPENYEQLSGGTVPFPVHAEELPEATVPAPLADREVTTTEFVGDRHVMLTFVFTRCSMSCPRLTANLVQVQAESLAEGFADEMAFLPVTFDPEHDTPEVIAEYQNERGVATDADNWWFLRPAGPQRAQEVVGDTFGVTFQYVKEENREMQNMAWVHSNRIVLANKDGYVERTYTGEPANPATVVDDVALLRERW